MLFFITYITTASAYALLPAFIFWPLFGYLSYLLLKSIVSGLCRAFYRGFIKPFLGLGRWQAIKDDMYDHVGFQVSDLPAVPVAPEPEAQDSVAWQKYKNSQQLG